MTALARGSAGDWRQCVPAVVALWAMAIASPTAYAAGTGLSVIFGGIGQDYASAVTSDAQGNIYVAGLTYSVDFPVTAGAAQTKFGGTCDAFVAKFGPDGTMLWSTYLGGILDDWATGIAVDSAGNVLVTGWTRSANFPLVNPTQGALDNGASDDYDAFVAKLDPTGSKLLYSTFLGGAADDGAAGIATDAAGNAYVAGTFNSATGFPGAPNTPNLFGIFVSKLNPQGALVYTFIHPYGSAGGIALDAAGSAYVTGSVSSINPSTATQVFGPPGNAYAIAFKISPDGSKKIYETALGGSVQANGAAIAVDSTGAAYIAGSTSSVDFPLVHAIQNSPGGRPLWKSADSGSTWAPLDNLPFALPQMLVVDPSAASTVYAATTDLGIFKSVDGGVTWTAANNGIANASVQRLTIDPVHPRTLYAYSAATPAYGTTAGAVYKTVDGADNWTLIDSPASAVSQLEVDAQNPVIVWEVGFPLRKSADGGVTWNPVTFPASVQSMALDPRVSGNIFAISNLIFCGIFCTDNQSPYIYHSADGGADWMRILSPIPIVPPGLTVDGSTNPSAIYDGLAYRSADGGVTWAPITPPSGANSTSATVAVDPNGTLYAAVYANGMFTSSNHAQTWTAIGSFIPPGIEMIGQGPAVNSIVPAGSTGTLYATTSQIAASAFVTKLSADGSSIVYSTYLRGHASMESYVDYLAEPGVFETQNWISSIALDAAGDVVVGGGTRSVDLPVVFPAQAANAGLADAFASTISADGSKLTYSTYVGGSQDDGALAVAVDSQGNVILAGQTWSYSDFPVLGPAEPKGGYGDAFVVRLPPSAAPVISSIVNGASLQAGIEAGSWVTIFGANLASTNPGRSWRAGEIVNGNLPTSLDGVSVTIDGKTAFVAYISPTQINVQAPSDTATGPVSVIVTNNGAASAPATAQLEAVAPAFFQVPGTSYAAASRLPDYAPVADPSAVPGAVAAKAGDLVVLWGTGFGATNPAVAAGTLVNGAPALVAAVSVTVGDVAATVIDTVLTPGDVGLYQVTIQIPAGAPSGAAALQASVGGARTASGVTLFVGQ